MLKGWREAREQRRLTEREEAARQHAEALEREREEARTATIAAQVSRERILLQNKQQIEAQRSRLETELKQYRRKVPSRETPIDESVAFWVRNLKFADEHLVVPGPDYRPALRPELIKVAKKLLRPSEQILGLGGNREISHYRTGDRPGRARSIYVFVTDMGLLVKPAQGAVYRIERDEARVVVDLGLDSAAQGPQPPKFDLGVPGDIPWSREMLFALWLQRRMAEERASASRSAPSRKRPQRHQILDFNDAERAAAEWMMYFGYSNVGVMPVGPDGGVDVYSDEALAQVKATTSPSTRPQIQQHLGVCAAQNKTPVFFSMAGYTAGAVDWAAKQGIILFSFNRLGLVVAANALAQAVIDKAERR